MLINEWFKRFLWKKKRVQGYKVQLKYYEQGGNKANEE